MTEDAGVGIRQGKRWNHGGADRGADVVFQTRADAGSLHSAMRALRPQGTVIDLAFYQGGADRLRLGEEFHHNGLNLRCAQINRVPRGLGFQWDRRRLAGGGNDRSCWRRAGAEIRAQLITHVVPLDDAPAFIARLVGAAAGIFANRVQGRRLIPTGHGSVLFASCSCSPGWLLAVRRRRCGCWRGRWIQHALSHRRRGMLPQGGNAGADAPASSRRSACRCRLHAVSSVVRRHGIAYLASKIPAYDLVVACQNVADVYPALERLHLRPPLIEHGGLVSEALAGPKHLTARYIGVCASPSETLRRDAYAWDGRIMRLRSRRWWIPG